MLYYVIGLWVGDLLYFLAYHLQRFEHFWASVLNLWQFIRDPSFLEVIVRLWDILHELLVTKGYLTAITCVILGPHPDALLWKLVPPSFGYHAAWICVFSLAFIVLTLISYFLNMLLWVICSMQFVINWNLVFAILNVVFTLYVRKFGQHTDLFATFIVISKEDCPLFRRQFIQICNVTNVHLEQLSNFFGLLWFKVLVIASVGMLFFLKLTDHACPLLQTFKNFFVAVYTFKQLVL